jgi:hypothetical protein
MSVSRPRRVLAFAVIAITAAAVTAIGSLPAPSAAPTTIAPAAAPPGIEAALAAREARAAARLRLADQRLRAVAASTSSSDDADG